MIKALDWKGQELKVGDYVVVVTMDSDQVHADKHPEHTFHWEYKVFRLKQTDEAISYVQYMDSPDQQCYPTTHLLKIPEHLANISARDKLELHVKLSGAWRGE